MFRWDAIRSDLIRLRVPLLLSGLFYFASLSLFAVEIDISHLPPPASTTVDFLKDIKPLLDSRCVKCHGPEKQKGDLRLDVKSVVLQGGFSGPALVPGKSAESLIIHLVAGLKGDELVMPQSGKRLTPEQIGLLRAWIDQGAQWPEGLEPADYRSQHEHWAFRAPVRLAPPPVRNRGTVRNAIDQFILARLEREGLAFSPEADRRTLIRRVYLDVLGLPPTPEEVNQFVNDRHADAYEKLVDRVLASPRYGERWARHWLDVVRFAETHGFETNTPRDNAWPYRDYVIRAFNEDKPYTQFIMEQLAGDALGADEATGFIVAGAWDAVKSPDVVLTANQRADELHDIVSTTGSAFLGLTVGCARCHNHKFDPISQKDYYAVKAVFAGVQHGERKLNTPGAEARLKQAEDLHLRLHQLEGQLTAYEPLANPLARQGELPGRSSLRAAVHPRQNADRFAPTAARFLRFTILETTGLEPCIDELEVYTSGENPHNVALSSLGAKASASSVYPNSPLHKLEHLNDGLYGNSRSWISSEAGHGWVQIELPEEVVINKVVWGRDREEKFSDRLATNYKIETALETNHWTIVASSADRQKFVAGQQFQPAYTTAGLSEGDAATLNRLIEERRALEMEIKELTAAPNVYAGNFTRPEPVHRLHRGDPMQKRELVNPGTLASIGFSEPEECSDTPEQERRLKFGRWLADPKNPLTARVMVNRIWQYHFGQGIVSTPSDFGINGARPTHPELLDWLALRFIEQGWKPKAIHRLILLSRTYRQTSLATTVTAAKGLDAGNRLLWRFTPRRLEAEAIRDSILRVSGKLDLKMGGPGYHVFEPNNNYVRVYNPKQEFGPAEWRRMIYQYKPRMQQDATFGAFDCPDGGQITPRRTSSTTPLQALNLLNSRFVVQQAEFFSERLQKEAGTKSGRQVQRAFQLAFGREASGEELKASIHLIQQHHLRDFCRAMLNANEFLYLF